MSALCCVRAERGCCQACLQMAVQQGSDLNTTPLVRAGTHMGKVLVQCGASEEARGGLPAAPRTSAPPLEDAKPAAAAHGAEGKAPAEGAAAAAGAGGADGEAAAEVAPESVAAPSEVCAGGVCGPGSACLSGVQHVL